jgi:hypothetical protein
MKRTVQSKNFGKVIFELVGENIRATLAGGEVLADKLWLGGKTGWYEGGGRYQAPVRVNLQGQNPKRQFEYEVLLWWRYHRLHDALARAQRSEDENPNYAAVPR